MNYDPLEYPYYSRRMTTHAAKGMVATSQNLAAQVGLEILRKGGNAMDSAIGTAASLTVLEPTNNGIGGDAFAIIWDGKELHGLNSSGPSPKSISIKALEEKGYEKMPDFGWEPVTVPGAPAAWSEMSDKFGNLPFEEVLQPAIRYAEEGFPISPLVGKDWKKYYQLYKDLEGEEFKHWFKTFSTSNVYPKIGEMWRSKDHARTLRKIAKTESKDFYEGEISRKIAEFSEESGGYLSRKDLKDFSPKWVNPMSVNYRDYEVWELPPNGQGIIALIALNILKEFEFESRNEIETIHKQIEAMKLAFADGKKYITDPDLMEINPTELISKNYSKKRKKLIGKKATDPQPGNPRSKDTVYLATADAKGNMVSFIQSNYQGFGSGLVVPDTGIALQNRGSLFTLNPNDPNCLEPEKRPYHTIIPGFLTKNNKPGGPFGVMGGYMQPQGHVQVIMNTLDFNLNPQATLDAPRWRWTGGKSIELEKSFTKYIANSLTKKGHDVKLSSNSSDFGKGQIIWKDKETLIGGTEPRAGGTVASW